MNEQYSTLMSSNSVAALNRYSNSESRAAAAQRGTVPLSIQIKDSMRRKAVEANTSMREDARRDYERMMEEHRDVMRRTEKASIKLTQKIFRSDRLFNCLESACKMACCELDRLYAYDPRNTRRNIAYKIKERGDLNPNYLLVQGTMIYFGKSKLPHAERDFIGRIFNASLDDYRRMRNADQRANRKVRKMKAQLEAEGITDITVRKIQKG